MSIPETVLTFVGAPAAIIAAVTLAVLGPGELRAPARYRPGRPWPHAPAWFVPHPDALAGDASTGSRRQVGGAGAAAITAASHTSSAAVGGATGEW